MNRIIFAVTLLMLCGAGGVKGQHMFDYGDIRAGKFREKQVGGVRSMVNGEHFTTLEKGTIERLSYKSGERVDRVFDIADHAQLKGAELFDYQYSADETKILLATNYQQIYRHSYRADHWIYDIKTKQISRLTEEGAEQVATFSPDGKAVGFVRDNDLYVVSLASMNVSRITSDGEQNQIINGHTDWVYEEEFGFTRAYEFSPDGEYIAYLRFDETAVPEFSFSRYIDGNYPAPYLYKYPLAGEKNAEAELWISDLSGDKTRVYSGAENDMYIYRIGWTPDNKPYYYRNNRLQNHFELVVVDGGEQSVVYNKSDGRYVEVMDQGSIRFLPKGDKFVVLDERSGYKHLYLHHIGKERVDTITQGFWEVGELLDVVENQVYYASNEGSVLRNNLYRVNLNGKGKKRLTQEEGVFRIDASSGFKYFISHFSNSTTPNIVRLHDGSGRVVRVLEDNAELRRRVSDMNIPSREFFTFQTERGTVLNGYSITPRNFDANKKYPVMMVQYSGPGSQYVVDRWQVAWWDVLVQEGYVVMCVDGRGTGGRGEEFRKVTYGNLGGLEVEDQISAAKYIATLPYVDLERIGIYGWSYGGFMTLNCLLKANTIFKMGIAVAPVTSWRFYDTIYTERYNALPQDNPRGYDANSPIEYADQLRGKLLMVHGTGDDNVHIRNTYRMADAFVRADKQFDIMIYPDDNHGMRPTGAHHVYELMIEYTLKNL